MRPYHSRHMIAAAAVSATVTVLVLKVGGYVSANTMQLSTVAVKAAHQLPASTQLEISCRHGLTMLTINTTGNRVITDHQGHPVSCLK